MLIAGETPYEQFKSVFEEYYQPLCNYAYTYTKDRDACEDIVQEIFLRVWEKKRDIIATKNVRYYLFSAVRNNCLSFIEKKKKSSALLVEDMAASLGTLPEEKIDSRHPDPLLLINEGLSLLPPKCKDAFLLSRIGDLSYQEIANSMNISNKTVENQIGKAIKILKDFSKEQKVLSILMGMIFFQILFKMGIGVSVKSLFY
jgi:RNA polymerase sigma-70 factor (family 1)